MRAAMYGVQDGRCASSAGQPDMRFWWDEARYKARDLQQSALLRRNQFASLQRVPRINYTSSVASVAIVEIYQKFINTSAVGQLRASVRLAWLISRAKLHRVHDILALLLFHLTRGQRFGRPLPFSAMPLPPVHLLSMLSDP